MQKAISDKIQLGQTLNPLKDYSGVPSVNNEGTLENLIGKVDNVTGFVATGKADGDLSRYYPNILPITIKSLANCIEKLMQMLLIQVKSSWNL